jgi:hypothetical protein
MVFSPCKRLYMSGHTLAPRRLKSQLASISFRFFLSPIIGEAFQLWRWIDTRTVRRMPAKCLRHLIFLANPTQIKRDNNTWSSVTTANLFMRSRLMRNSNANVEDAAEVTTGTRERKRENRLVDDT